VNCCVGLMFGTIGRIESVVLDDPLCETKADVIDCRFRLALCKCNVSLRIANVVEIMDRWSDVEVVLFKHDDVRRDVVKGEAKPLKKLDPLQTVYDSSAINTMNGVVAVILWLELDEHSFFELRQGSACWRRRCGHYPLILFFVPFHVYSHCSGLM
jgi:hypothetical protein